MAEGPSRSLYFGNINPAVTYYDVCKLANEYGALELVKIVPEKKCAFVNFVNQDDAERLYNESLTGNLELYGQKAIVGWAKAAPIRPEIQAAIEQGATRNLFVAGIGGASEHTLSALFLQFGDIENIVCTRKGFGFVNMTSVKKAMEAKEVCDTKGIDLAGRRLVVKFAKEGVPARDPRTVIRHQPQFPAPMFDAGRYVHPGHAMAHGSPYPRPGSMQGPGVPGSRAIYLGNLPEEIENADICKLGNKYGALELVRLNKEKKNGFINFIDASSAEEMFLESQSRPVMLNNVQIKVGWAKSAPLRPEIQEAISHGATRNLYIGNISDNIDEEHLRELIAPYCHGEFDGIHILRPKKIAFVNLISIKAAIQARQALQSGGNAVELDGQPIKINFAKETVSRRGGAANGLGMTQQWPEQHHFQHRTPQQQAPAPSHGHQSYDSFDSQPQMQVQAGYARAPEGAQGSMHMEIDGGSSWGQPAPAGY